MSSWKISRVVFGTMALVGWLVVAAPAAETSGLREVPFVEGQPAPDVESGKAWCLVKKPPVFESVTEKVLVSPATFYMKTIPPKYETREERVMVQPVQEKKIYIPAKYREECVKECVKEESYEYKTIPAKYEWIEKRVVDSPARTEEVFIPAKTKQVQKRIMIAPPRKEKITVDCESIGARPEGNQEYCVTEVEVPAQYETVCQTVICEPARTETKTIPATYKTIRVRKLVEPARVEKVACPAEYETVRRKVLAEPARWKTEAIPARYKTVQKQVMVEPARQERVNLPAKYETICRKQLVRPAQWVWRQTDEPCQQTTRGTLATRRTTRSNCVDCSTTEPAPAPRAEDSSVAAAIDRYGSIPAAPAHAALR